MRIAFAGNPNSGKTTMYNALTGRNEKVGNWAGVTVDKKEAPIKKAFAGDLELVAVDLPGAYSMSPFTAEESVTSAEPQLILYHTAAGIGYSCGGCAEQGGHQRKEENQH